MDAPSALPPYAQRRLELALDCAPLAMMLSDAAMTPLHANPALERMLGYGSSELRALGPAGVLAPGDRALLARLNRELFRQLRETYQIELRYRHRDGHELWCRVDAALAPELPQFCISALEDISERKHLEARTRRLIGSYEQILNATGWGVLVVDRRATISFVNSAAAQRLGWMATDLIGQSLDQVRVARPTPQRSCDECQIVGTLHDGLARPHGRGAFRRRDGSTFLTDAALTPIVEGGIVSAVVVTFASAGAAL